MSNTPDWWPDGGSNAIPVSELNRSQRMKWDLYQAMMRALNGDEERTLAELDRIFGDDSDH